MTRFLQEKLQKSMCFRDLGVDVVARLPPQHHIRKRVKEIDYLMVNVKIALKSIDNEIFGK